MKPAGIIFDMDDTLVATAALWKEAEDHLLRQLGSAWSPEMALQYKGMNTLDVAATMHRLLCPPVSLEFCQKTLRDTLLQAFDSAPPPPMRGAVECVRRLANLAPIAVASGSPLSVIGSVLAQLEIRPEFKCLISSESVSRGKPFPDVFLAAAATLGAPPQSCLVLEDSLVGVQAAKAAGMVCFAIPLCHSDEIVEAADRTFASLDDIDIRAITLALKPGVPSSTA